MARDPSKVEFLSIEVVGNSTEQWARLRTKFLGAIDQLLDTVVDDKSNATVRDEAKNLATALLADAKARLAKSGWENDQIAAHVEKTYAEIETIRASARKVNAEAQSIELQNSVKKLRLLIMATNALMAGETDGEAVLLGKQMKAFLEVVDHLQRE
jgi:hypothetical protein